MLITLAALVVAFSPILLIVAVVALVERRNHMRAAIVARQIRLTDAIAAELGAIVAPVVRKRFRGRWQIEMAMPLGRPATVGRVLSIAHQVLPGRYEFVLTPQSEPVSRPAEDAARAARRLRTA